VPDTFADTGLISGQLGYTPKTDIREGVGKFVDWYRRYYRV
jgi:UDP-glucuronate 4-epimerase